MKVYSPTRLLTLTGLLATLLLFGCAPHPGSGSWKAEENDAGIVRLDVKFDGKASLYIRRDEKITLSCLWGAESKTRVLLGCKEKDNVEEALHYNLDITESGKAVLSMDGKAIANMSKLTQ